VQQYLPPIPSIFLIPEILNKKVNTLPSFVPIGLIWHHVIQLRGPPDPPALGIQAFLGHFNGLSIGIKIGHKSAILHVNSLLVPKRDQFIVQLIMYVVIIIPDQFCNL